MDFAREDENLVGSMNQATQQRETSESPLATMILHIFTVSTLVFARPLYDVFSTYPEYFIVNRVDAPQIYLWICVLSLLIPLALAAALVITRLVSQWLAYHAYTFVVASLLGIFMLQITKSIGIDIAPVAFALALMMTGVAAWLLLSKPQMASVFTLLSPMVAVFPILFLINDSVQKITAPAHKMAISKGVSGARWIGKTHPVVFVIFDEFALVDLLDANGDVDGKRFPNIEAFAKRSTWYSNASTVRYATTWAIPPILTGSWPNSGALPRYQEYPRNLFSLLQAQYHFNVIEPVTDLSNFTGVSAPADRDVVLQQFLQDTFVVYLHQVTPDDLTVHLPPIGSQWGGFLSAPGDPVSAADDTQSKLSHEERVARKQKHQERMRGTINGDRKQPFRSFILGFDFTTKQSLHFLHLLLPHRPTVYLPSGKKYTTTQRMVGVHEDRKTKSWVGLQSTVDKLHQRQLLQLAFVDHLWGVLVSKLQAVDIYDESLIVLVADHGISYRSGIPNRRPSAENFGDVAFVPLFIKYPFQKLPKIDESNVETIDILPTIIDVLDISVDWKFDGRSLVDDSVPVRPNKELPTAYGDLLRYTEPQYLAARKEAHQRTIMALRLHDPRASLFNYEDGLEFIGKAFGEFASSSVECRIQSRSLDVLNEVDLSKEFVGLRISGRIKCPAEVASPLLLFMIEDRVIANTRPYSHDGNLVFDHVLSDESMRPEHSVETVVVDYSEFSRWPPEP